VKEATLLLIVSLALIVLLLFSCAVIGLLVLWPAQEEPAGPAGGQTAPPGAQGGNQTNVTPPAGPSQADLEIWQKITNDNVEQACLSQARKEAGPSADLVYSCACEETDTDGRKTFACNIDTADPLTRYFANIDCYLDARACTVETNYGTQTVGFDQLQNWYG
jgi:hypothetical protein